MHAWVHPTVPAMLDNFWQYLKVMLTEHQLQLAAENNLSSLIGQIKIELSSFICSKTATIPLKIQSELFFTPMQSVASYSGT